MTQLQNVAAAPMCDQQPGKVAVWAYQWPWEGPTSKGVCCAEQGMLFQQIAEQIGRQVTLIPLQNVPAAPLERDERTKLKATALVLEEEIQEHKLRALELYRQNGLLVQQVQLLTVRQREAELLLRDGAEGMTKLNERIDRRDIENGELVAEVERLRVLASFVESERPRTFSGAGGSGGQPPPLPPTEPPTEPVTAQGEPPPGGSTRRHR